MDPKADFPRPELSLLLGISENSPTKVKKEKNANVVISQVLGTFRSHFCAQASNPKANHAANRKSLAATAGIRGVRIELGGQMIRNWDKNHLFKNRVDLIKR